MPCIEDTTHANNLLGGIVAYWLEEAGSKTASQPTIGQIKLSAEKLIGYTEASDELLEDSAIGLEALLKKLFASAIAWYEDYAFLRGNGVGQPLGILNSPALATIARGTGTTVKYADLVNMLIKLLPNSYGKAVWLFSQSTMGQVFNLKDSNNNLIFPGGTFAPGVAGKVPTTLLGMPYIFTEKLPVLGVTGDVLLADLSWYYVGDREALTVNSSEHVKFTTDQTVWRFVQRVDGQPALKSTLTLKDTSAVSPFVALTDAL
jgi:HK97 family phage major capsid protein